MNAQRILVPTDFSSSADAALPYASALARETGAKITILHIEEPSDQYVGAAYYGKARPRRSDLLAMLERLRPTVENVPFERRLESSGDPALAIVRVAEDEGYDMIVLGTHGRGATTTCPSGSVAELVVRGAPCPVLTVKRPEGSKRDECE
jgi:nucleotide-binding universal stress UspA family protein